MILSFIFLAYDTNSMRLMLSQIDFCTIDLKNSFSGLSSEHSQSVVTISEILMESSSLIERKTIFLFSCSSVIKMAAKLPSTIFS